MGNQSKDHGRAWPTIAAKACPNRSVRSIYAIGAVLLRNLSHHADFPEVKLLPFRLFLAQREVSGPINYTLTLFCRDFLQS